jgi:hypothetical protein
MNTASRTFTNTGKGSDLDCSWAFSEQRDVWGIFNQRWCLIKVSVNHIQVDSLTGFRSSRGERGNLCVPDFKNKFFSKTRKKSHHFLIVVDVSVFGWSCAARRWLPPLAWTTCVDTCVYLFLFGFVFSRKLRHCFLCTLPVPRCRCVCASIVRSPLKNKVFERVAQCFWSARRGTSC